MNLVLTKVPLRIIGAVDGIYEFHVDMFSRRVFPSMEMR